MCDTDHRALLLNAHRFQFFRTFTWSYSAWNHNSHRLIQFLSRTKKNITKKRKLLIIFHFVRIPSTLPTILMQTHCHASNIQCSANPTISYFVTIKLIFSLNALIYCWSILEKEGARMREWKGHDTAFDLFQVRPQKYIPDY